ncbi:MAG: hypothetical protein QOJ81_2238, partial [Chloroflexota bacterium]|nr:hypothetical protein [Chloroflexota bacterium]
YVDGFAYVMADEYSYSEGRQVGVYASNWQIAVRSFHTRLLAP